MHPREATRHHSSIVSGASPARVAMPVASHRRIADNSGLKASQRWHMAATRGVSRRGFLGTAAAAVLTSGLRAAEQAAPQASAGAAKSTDGRYPLVIPGYF